MTEDFEGRILLLDSEVADTSWTMVWGLGGRLRWRFDWMGTLLQEKELKKCLADQGTTS